MAHVLQFPCPACGMTLQIPSAGAGQRGPCPHCRQPIIAPDPLRGAPACRLAAQPFEPAAVEIRRPVQQPAPQPQYQPQPQPQPFVPPVEILQPVQPQPQTRSAQPFQPAPARPFETRPAGPFQQAAQTFVEQAPVPRPQAAPVYVEQAPAPRPQPAQAATSIPVLQPAPEPASFKAGLSTSILVGTLGCILAFAGGYQSGKQERIGGSASSSKNPPKAAADVPAPAKATPAPAPVANTLAAPRAVLDAFLAAADARTRGQYILFPDAVLPKMEAYYAKHPQGPISAYKIKVNSCSANENTDVMTVVFRIVTANAIDGFPVAVMETPDGWKVDWEGFVEFQDRLFQKFTNGQGDETAAFRLILLPSESDKPATSVTVSDPVSGATRVVSLGKNPGLAPELAKLISGRQLATPVLNLARTSTPEGPQVEIVSIKAASWWPEPN